MQLFGWGLTCVKYIWYFGMELVCLCGRVLTRARAQWSTDVLPPTDGGTDRWRAELRDAGSWPSPAFPRTLTNHIFVPSSSGEAARGPRRE